MFEAVQPDVPGGSGTTGKYRGHGESHRLNIHTDMHRRMGTSPGWISAAYSGAGMRHAACGCLGHGRDARGQENCGSGGPLLHALRGTQYHIPARYGRLGACMRIGPQSSHHGTALPLGPGSLAVEPGKLPGTADSGG